VNSPISNLSSETTSSPLAVGTASKSLEEKKKSFRTLRTFLIYLTLVALLYFALRNAPLGEIWNTLSQLQFWHIAVLFGLNLFIYALITMRWWIIVRAESKRVAYIPLLLVRVAVFGVSYFTLGPHVGGEPLQVFYLQRKYKFTYMHATASVILDKLLELLANFFLLALGLTAIFQAGILSTNGSSSWLSLSGLVLLCLWPPIHIILLYKRKYPFTVILRSIPFIKKDAKVVRFVAASERLAGTFCRRHLSSLLFAILISLCAGAGMVGEFALITYFVQIQLPFWQTVSAWTAGWLSLLAPLPGGLGALEASQVFALGLFGIAATSAISVTLLMRGRDILIGGIGLLLAGRGVGK
jgi:uncharacterized protein (TIRG00374 family)